MSKQKDIKLGIKIRGKLGSDFQDELFQRLILGSLETIKSYLEGSHKDNSMDILFENIKNEK